MKINAKSNWRSGLKWAIYHICIGRIMHTSSLISNANKARWPLAHRLIVLLLMSIGAASKRRAAASCKLRAASWKLRAAKKRKEKGKNINDDDKISFLYFLSPARLHVGTLGCRRGTIIKQRESSEESELSLSRAVCSCMRLN